MTLFSVNINKIALIRNSRGANYPDLIKSALDCERYGAQGITVHPRPDQRHVRYSDIPVLKDHVTTEFNIEGYPTPEFLDLVIKNKLAQCTLVPDAPEALTSDNGWDTISNSVFLSETIKQIKDAGIRVSLFIDPDKDRIYAAKECGADRIEFYTGPYAHQFHKDKNAAIAPFVEAAQFANSIGIGINAGHDLNLDNLRFFKENIPNLLEVSIGHAVICDAIYLGLKNTIQLYLRELE